MIFLLLVVAALVTVSVYWWRFAVWSNPSYSIVFVALLFVLATLLVYAKRLDLGLTGRDVPTLIVIAADVSLSMGTQPDPRVVEGAGTRLERARAVLRPVLAELDAATAPAMISITAFTSRSETVLAWDENLPQVSEVIDYVLEAGLLTEPGSDLGAGLAGIKPLLDILPERYRDRERSKFLIVVSDGEQTVEQMDVAMALAELREAGIRIIALHVGMQDVAEGLAVYDDAGGFIGFDEVGGQIYSTPDRELMKALAGAEAAEGIFVDAEDSDAVAEVMNFMGVSTSKMTAGPGYVALVLSMWALSTILLLRLA